MINKEIILIGGGGHCKACIDVIETENKYKIIGIVDVKDKFGQKVLGYPVIASDDDLVVLAKKYKNFLITIGQIKNSQVRKSKFDSLKELGVNFPTIVSPTAYISKTAQIGEGTIIMHGVIINPEVKIGTNCIINNKALLEHESVIGSNTHISTGAVVNGQNEIGSDVFIGSGSVTANNIKVTSNTIIGAGAVVVNSISDAGTYVGNPARRIK